MPVTSYYSKTKRVTAYLLLFLQLFFPVSTATLSVAYAAEHDNELIMSETFDGLNALMDTSPSPAPPPKPQGGKTASGSTLSGEGFTVEMPSGSEYGVMPAGSDSGFISGQNGMPFPMSVSTLPDLANPHRAIIPCGPMISSVPCRPSVCRIFLRKMKRHRMKPVWRVTPHRRADPLQ